jgi:hypothetical protein
VCGSDTESMRGRVHTYNCTCIVSVARGGWWCGVNGPVAEQLGACCGEGKAGIVGAVPMRGRAELKAMHVVHEACVWLISLVDPEK